MDPSSRQKPGQCEPTQESMSINQMLGLQQQPQPSPPPPPPPHEQQGWSAQNVFSWLAKAIGLRNEEQLTSAASMLHHSSSITAATILPAIVAANSTAAATTASYHQMAQPEQIIQSTAAMHQMTAAAAAAAELPAFQLEALNEGWQLLLSILYSLTAITSFVLNVITVIVLARCNRSGLRKYLINLSLSDLLMSLFSILTLSVFVSAATMTVIGINRHLAIIYPFREKQCSRLPKWTLRKIHVIVTIWLIGIVISTPEYLMFGVEPFCYDGHNYNECRQLWPDTISQPYAIFIYLFTFAIPLCLLCYLYSCIGLKLWRRQMPGNVDANRDSTMHTIRSKVSSHHASSTSTRYAINIRLTNEYNPNRGIQLLPLLRNEEQVIKMLFVVVIMFAVSWLPLQTYSMVLFIYPSVRENIEYKSLEYNIFVCTYFVCHWLSMAHSCLNPLIYCFMNDKFRSDLHTLICKRDKYFARGSHQMTQQQHSSHPQQQLAAANGHWQPQPGRAILLQGIPMLARDRQQSSRSIHANKQQEKELRSLTGGGGGDNENKVVVVAINSSNGQIL